MTELVRRRPYSVLLFDEIEKGHPDVFNIFLQILEDGRLTDGKGRTVDFKNTVIIMTSNIGSSFIHEAMNGVDHAIGMTTKVGGAVGEAGALSEGLKRKIQEALLQHFRPEFLNRIDEVVIFNALGKAEIEKIIDLQLQNLRRLLSERKVDITLTEKAHELLYRDGYDPQFGARPLKRAIQRLIQDPLAMKLLDGEVVPGDSLTIDADMKKGVMTFTPGKAKAAKQA